MVELTACDIGDRRGAPLEVDGDASDVMRTLAVVEAVPLHDDAFAGNVLGDVVRRRARKRRLRALGVGGKSGGDGTEAAQTGKEIWHWLREPEAQRPPARDRSREPGRFPREHLARPDDVREGSAARLHLRIEDSLERVDEVSRRDCGALGEARVLADRERVRLSVP